MNEQEAIAELRKIYIDIDDCSKYPPFEVAYKALEKQIPRKAVNEGNDEQSFIRCPECRCIIGIADDCDYDNYCANCGQAIDWEN